MTIDNSYRVLYNVPMSNIEIGPNSDEIRDNVSFVLENRAFKDRLEEINNPSVFGIYRDDTQGIFLSDTSEPNFAQIVHNDKLIYNPSRNVRDDLVGLCYVDFTVKDPMVIDNAIEIPIATLLSSIDDYASYLRTNRDTYIFLVNTNDRSIQVIQISSENQENPLNKTKVNY